MHMPTPDAELLRRYAEKKDLAAFAELVRQNLPLVYRCACRSLDGDTTRAQDVAQEVFVDLARKASALADHPALAAWLHTTTRYASAEMRRGEQRRQQRHEEVRNMHEIENSGSSEPSWERLQPVIDDALASLGEPDREAVLLRFFAEKTHAEIGSRLGLGEDAARMRVEHALEKLRARLVQRGILSTGAALGSALGGQGALAVPAGLATTITKAALAAVGSTVGTGFLATWLATGGGKLIAGSSLAVALAGGAVAFSRLSGSDAPAPTSVSTKSAQAVTPTDAWAALIDRWDFSTEAERGYLFRSVEAGELGARLLRLWRDNDSASRRRFWSIFDHWCAASPEAAAKWSASTWDEITGEDGVKLREQAGFVWVKRSPRPAFEWARTLRDADEESGLAARMLWQLAHTDSGEAIALAKDVSDKFYQTARFGILEGWFTRDRAAAIERLGDECVKHPRMPDLLGRWSEADVVGFTTWGKLGRMAFSASEEPSFDQRRLRAEAARAGVSRLSDLGRFVSALFVEYLDKTPSLSPDPGQSLMMIDGAFLTCCDSFDLWRDRDPVAALKWLQGLPAQATSTQKFLLRWGGTSKENRDGTRDHAAQNRDSAPA
jgi:RNA polymerase sigma factor (sigma-70 family)